LANLPQDLDFVAKKLEISSQELLDLLEQPNRHFTDYKNNVFKRNLYFKLTDLMFRVLYGYRSVRKALRRKE